MDIPYVRGRVARQAHVGVPDGTYEEEYGRNGFSGRYAHLYRTDPPVGWTRIEGPLKPRAYDLRELGMSAAWNRTPVLGNADVKISTTTLTEAMPYFFRNADADEVLFVHEGAGRMETDYGPLAYEAGDYLVIPRGTTYRVCPTSASYLLTIESFSEVSFPDRGLLGQHALFDPAVIKVPTPGETTSATANAQGEYELRIQRLGEMTSVFYPFSPINTVGWKGTACVQQINVRDIRPILSDRYHLPPSAHATLVMQNAVICTFLPRPLENGDPEAVKVPFYHSNIDFDEVLFYHSGDFFSREGINAGMLTFHPQGIHHGPQPGAVTRTKSVTRTEEVAVMIDTRRPLEPYDAVAKCEQTSYWKSWQKKGV